MKKKQYATCALDSTSPKEGRGGGGSRVGYMLAVSPFATFLKVYFGPINFCLFCCVNLGVLQFVGSLSCVWQ